ETMATTVWETLCKYNLQAKIIAFVMDNATNNDTMTDAIERKCLAAGIPFEAKRSRMRCMPHTVHLAALKLLEAVGALTKDEATKAQSSSRRAAYQEIVTQADNDETDRNTIAQAADSDSEDDENEGLAPSQTTPPRKGVSLAVYKLRRIVKHVRSSPQRRRSWELTVRVALDQLNEELAEAQLMLILDVRTRWTSTHQMLRTCFIVYLMFGRLSH
ncbi:hypothetical protein DFH06DRAFT_989446, partial [Mycena polygramma]